VPSTPPTVVILGIPFHNVSFDEAVEWARQRILSRRPGYIATANMDFVMQSWRDPELQRILLEADLVVADGIPIVWLSRLLGPRLKARVTGSDLVPLLARMARDHHFSIYHLGGAAGVPEKAAEVLVRKFPGLRIAGCYSPPWANILDMDHATILGKLQEARPDLLFVAFGAPKQEKWVNLHVHRWNVPLAIGVGGSLDFLAGTQQRAPRMVQRLALEWLWRMCSDPPRLVNRYLRNITFFLHALVDLTHIRLGPDRAQPPVGDNPALRRMALVEPFVRLTEPAQVEAFCAAILDKAAGRPAVLDLAGVRWISSLEQGALLRLTTQLRRRHLPLLLTGVGTRIRLLLNWCHLAEYLEIECSHEELGERITAWNSRSRQGAIVQEKDGRIFVQLPDELTAANLDAFRRRIDECASFAQARERVLDAADTRFVDSSAIGLFMRLKKQADASSASLYLINLQPAVRRIFQVAKIDSVLLDQE